MTGDVNNGDLDYKLDPNAADFTHAHTDLQDKRHNLASLGVDQKYPVDGATGYLVGGLRWPNFGAWAGFNSVVICANADPTTPTNIADPQWLHAGSERTVALSVGSNDYRSERATSGTWDCANDSWAQYQFNFRQIGTKVVVCGPGQLPDTGDSRCTWNWNYDSHADFGAGTSTDDDPEGFFDRNDNMAVAVWSRKRRDAVSRTAAAADQPVNAAANLSTNTYTFTFNDQDGDAISGNIEIKELSDNENEGTGSITVSGNEVTVQCDNSPFTGGTDVNQRDLFPTCFTGDEVHLKVNYQPNALTSDNRGFISPWYTTVSVVYS